MMKAIEWISALGWGDAKALPSRVYAYFEAKSVPFSGSASMVPPAGF